MTDARSPAESAEQWLTQHGDGSVSLDAYAGWSRDKLKDRCRELCMALDEWRFTAISAATDGSNTMENVREPYRSKIQDVIDAYDDEAPHPRSQPESAWQPIETAPITPWSAELPSYYSFRCLLADGNRVYEGFAEYTIKTHQLTWKDARGYKLNPKHWMPLPEGPRHD